MAVNARKQLSGAKSPKGIGSQGREEKTKIKNGGKMGCFRDLIVYRKGFSLAMEIFEISKHFPKEELYSLTDQVRRSSRSVCSNIGEGYRKRRYSAHFISKISDADMENSETQVWLQFAQKCNYITDDLYNTLLQKSEEIGKLLSDMICNPAKYS